MGASPDPSLVLASNRDEFYRRQGEPPSFETAGQYTFVAPKDSLKGGTWFGLNEAGLVVALTNRLDETSDPDAPSRGLLVRSLLSDASSRRSAEERYKSLDPPKYNAHRILLIDAGGMTSFESSPGPLERYERESGFFYLDNQKGFLRDQEVLGRHLPAALKQPKSGTGRALEAFVSSHEALMERESICLHADVAGTVSSSLLVLNSSEELVEYRFSQGQPCEQNFTTVSFTDSFRHALLKAWMSSSNPSGS